MFLILIAVKWSNNNSLYGENLSNTLKIDEEVDCSDYVGNMVIRDFITGLRSSVMKHSFGLTMTWVALGLWGFLAFLLLIRRCAKV